MSPPVSERPMPKKQGSWWVLGRSDSSDKDKENEKEKGGKGEKGEKGEKGKDKNKSDTSSEVVVAKSAPPMAVSPAEPGKWTFLSHPQTSKADYSPLI